MDGRVSEDSSLDVWKRIASWWDAQIGEGNAFQKQLIMPATDRLLNLKCGERVIDACCGNGNYARRMVDKFGVNVFAFDGAPDFIALSKSRAARDIDYATLDATNQEQLEAALGDSQFDAAVCSMALMDLPTLSPLLRAIHRALKTPGGRFVFSVPHPCFNSPHTHLAGELGEVDGQPRQTFDLRITDYLDASPTRSSGLLNQPEPHAFFHRPLTALLGECFAAGFTIDAVDEPAFPAGAPARSAFSWAKRPGIPPVLIVRLRR